MLFIYDTENEMKEGRLMGGWKTYFHFSNGVLHNVRPFRLVDPNLAVKLKQNTRKSNAQLIHIQKQKNTTFTLFLSADYLMVSWT